jgi:short-subunit dehydrogenase
MTHETFKGILEEALRIDTLINNAGLGHDRLLV